MAENFKTRLKSVKGLGSAHAGTAGWLALRISALALIPLCLWFVYAVLHLLHSDYAEVIHWLKNPINTLLILLLIPCTFYHSYGGLKEVIEDYVHKEFWKICWLIKLKLFFILLGVADIFAALYICFRL